LASAPVYDLPNRDGNIFQYLGCHDGVDVYDLPNRDGNGDQG